MAISPAERQQILALIAAGHSNSHIQRETGIDRGTVARYRSGRLPQPRTTAGDKQCRNGHAYPDNQRTDSNGWRYCIQCRRDKANRWYAHNPQRVQPDEAAILRAVDGNPPQRLTPRERTEAVRRLDRQGLTADAIADRLRCHRNTVQRARDRIKRTAA